MLFRLQGDKHQFLAFDERRQRYFFVSDGIDHREAGECHFDFPGFKVPLSGGNVHIAKSQAHRCHLTRHEATPDETIQPQLGLIKIGFQVFRAAINGGGPNRLMRLLRAFTGLVRAGFGGQVFIAEVLGNVCPRLGLSLGGDTHRIRSHIGNESGMAFVSDFNSFV